MPLIRCYDCGKEVSSLATACPACGAPPRSTIAPTPLRRQTSRAKQLFGGTIALLTGVVLVLVVRGVTHRPNSLSGASPMPATAETTAKSSPPLETASQTSASLDTAGASTAKATTVSSPPVEEASQSSPSRTTTETSTAEATTTSSPPVEEASQSSPSRTTPETLTAEAITTSSPFVETASRSSPSLA